ncbi:Na(+)/H(+) antiporter subunit F1 [Oceanobacillus piezotolerans]|uniref:Na(+)/H(+) antiporter subunit F1 n=1 Tax=Oceanobacillus piezotolerans TaxID=2448030 RepID=A0A498D3D2_9BACI|nr:Na(+)/H(+) antiporter subunit F1 [Oceanobacillus piezotolerans]RLL42721.1 Na(+)/H(+) antiporter subunit F1 [Oceanobacillus piezotolerans]
MIQTILYFALTLFGIAIAIALFRIVFGPSLPDRVIALDMIGVNLISSMAIISIIIGTTFFLDVILIIGIIAFISTIAFSKYIERGGIIERKRDD